MKAIAFLGALLMFAPPSTPLPSPKVDLNAATRWTCGKSVYRTADSWAIRCSNWYPGTQAGCSVIVNATQSEAWLAYVHVTSDSKFWKEVAQGWVEIELNKDSSLVTSAREEPVGRLDGEPKTEFVREWLRAYCPYGDLGGAHREALRKVRATLEAP